MREAEIYHRPLTPWPPLPSHSLRPSAGPRERGNVTEAISPPFRHGGLSYVPPLPAGWEGDGRGGQGVRGLLNSPVVTSSVRLALISVSLFLLLFPLALGKPGLPTHLKADEA